MTVTTANSFPSRRGEHDLQHFKERVRKQIVEHLRKKIGQEDIITGGDRIRVPVKGTKQYRFILDRKLKKDKGAGQGTGPGGGGDDPGVEEYEVWLDMNEVEELLFQELELPRLRPKNEEVEVTKYQFDSYAVKGPQIDKKATLKRNLLRNAAQGNPGLRDFKKDDLRYISWHEKVQKKSKAVVFLCMDVSGSMGAMHKQIARLFFYWVVKFLRTRYTSVEVKFISHTTEAKEVTEHEFFNRTESGGTMVSSAYKLAYEMYRRHYPESEWNIYVFHASDGDNWTLDNEECFQAIKKLCQISSLVGYLEIRAGHQNWIGLLKTLRDSLVDRQSELQNFMVVVVRNEKDIWNAIKTFFAKENVESAVVK